jgi:hypothetical protein
MFPVLSGMEDGRKRASARAVRLTSAIIAPLAGVVIAYPYVPLSMMGPSYVASSFALQLLAVGCFAAPTPPDSTRSCTHTGSTGTSPFWGWRPTSRASSCMPPSSRSGGDSGAAFSYISGYAFSLGQSCSCPGGSGIPSAGAPPRSSPPSPPPSPWRWSTRGSIGRSALQ